MVRCSLLDHVQASIDDSKRIEKTLFKWKNTWQYLLRLKGEHETTATGLNNNASFYHFERKTHVHYGRVRYRGKIDKTV